MYNNLYIEDGDKYFKLYRNNKNINYFDISDISVSDNELIDYKYDKLEKY